MDYGRIGAIGRHVVKLVALAGFKLELDNALARLAGCNPVDGH